MKPIEVGYFKISEKILFGCFGRGGGAEEEGQNRRSWSAASPHDRAYTHTNPTDFLPPGSLGKGPAG